MDKSIIDEHIAQQTHPYNSNHYHLPSIALDHHYHLSSIALDQHLISSPSSFPSFPSFPHLPRSPTHPFTLKFHRSHFFEFTPTRNQKPHPDLHLHQSHNSQSATQLHHSHHLLQHHHGKHPHSATMPGQKWTTESELKLLLTIIEVTDPKPPSWSVIATAMGPGFTAEAVRYVFFPSKSQCIHHTHTDTKHPIPFLSQDTQPANPPSYPPPPLKPTLPSLPTLFPTSHLPKKKANPPIQPKIRKHQKRRQINPSRHFNPDLHPNQIHHHCHSPHRHIHPNQN